MVNQTDTGNQRLERSTTVSHGRTLDLKFRSCPPFRQTLLSSDDFIDHTVPDTYWGTGIDKRDPGQNVFGLILARLVTRICLVNRSGSAGKGQVGHGIWPSRIGMRVPRLETASP
jgi:hypothetical protein